MSKYKDNAQLINESSYQEFFFALGVFCRSSFPDSPNRPKAPNAYEKLQMPLKGIMNLNIATPSSNQW